MSDDKRQYPRVEAELVVRSAALEPASTHDLSTGGVFVRTARFLPVNAVIRLTVEVPNPRVVIPMTCRVAFIRDASSLGSGRPAGMGLEILDVAPDRKVVLDRLLAERTSGARPPVSVRGAGALKVVVVDDDEHYRAMAAEPFLRRGDQVRSTADGLEALSMCLQDPPDVILSDVQMPRMDGWQLLRMIRARPSLASVPVVFLTSLNGDAERLLGYQLGVDAYIPKPYNPEELLVRVHQIVRRARNSLTSPIARTTLRGELEHVGTASLLSFVEMEKKTGILLLVGERVARLFLREGRLMRAEVEGERWSSREAVMRVLGWSGGQFEFAPQDVSGPDDLGMTVTALLLEHARLTDEARGA
jgi:CheY-like chemotaxis protein/Tfp pilus assembly protein PilZ